ncbi:MAG TPA: hypothetical protein VI248_25995 [Kineosporiaceae bacterium]
MTPTGNASKISAWFTERLPVEWTATAAPEVTVDREEITVILALPGLELASDATQAERAEAAAGRIARFRADTRERRIEIAREAEHRFRRKVAWGVTVGERRELFTHLAVPVMTRLRQPERRVLDTLVDAGVARSRAHALAWCVRLVGENTQAWLSELREAMEQVERVRSHGPAGRAGVGPESDEGAGGPGAGDGQEAAD